jgi:hypothetical protein
LNNEIFEKQVDLLLAQKELPPLSLRITEVYTICEVFYKMTGRVPQSYQLDRLGNYILADTLRDKSTHKVKHTEYPVLSYTQVKLRNRRERRVGDDNLDFIKGKEIDNNPNHFKVKTRNKEE